LLIGNQTEFKAKFGFWQILLMVIKDAGKWPGGKINPWLISGLYLTLYIHHVKALQRFGQAFFVRESTVPCAK
jgi:hypothetical protein